MKGLQRLITNTLKAINDYNMISDGDTVAIGISGGKDSIAMLLVLDEIRRYFNLNFELVPITIDLSFENIGKNKTNYTIVNEICARLNVRYHIVKTDIAEIIFNIRKEPNPCSLCSKMRRGALCNKAIELGANKLVLAHHFDDVIETFVLNMFYEGRFGCFSPVTKLEGIDIIRPMIYSQEKDIKYFINSIDLPIIINDCPEDKHTERENIKKLLNNLEKTNKGLKHRIFNAIKNAHLSGF